MIDRYFQEELAHLKELAAEFAAAHPALAPLLGSASADPDVERLLEGVAFQNGLLRQKLADDFPEFIHDLVRLVCPHYLRPIPAATLVAFTPAPSLTRPQTVPAGTQLASLPVEDTHCLFRTCADVELHPLEILDASFEHAAGQGPAISLKLRLTGGALAQWNPRSVRFFLAGDFPPASDLYLLLSRHLLNVVITADGCPAATLPADCLRPAGFEPAEAVIPYPSHAFPGFRLIQEYFTIPQRFLFLDLFGWERWDERGRGSTFTVRFQLGPFSLPPPRIKRESFALFVTPAVNLFKHDGEPIRLDHRKERYPVRPEGLPPDHVQVFSVDRVSGLCHGSGREGSYHPFELFRSVAVSEPSYHIAISPSPVRRGFRTEISVGRPALKRLPEEETLSLELTCTNGNLPKGLRLGDICHATATSPESATFRNIAPVTDSIEPPLDHALLWRLVSHQALNLQHISGAENVRALLRLYLFGDAVQENALTAANRRRIDGIEDVVCSHGRHLVRGVPVQGTEIRLEVNGDHFAGPGDIFLFGCVLDQLFACLACLNTYTRLTIHESTRGGNLEWHPRLGEQMLL